MEKINKETVDLILSKRLNEDFWLFELGRAEIIDSPTLPFENHFLYSFLSRGELIWNEQKNKLITILCDKKNKTLKKILKNVTSEGYYELISTIISQLIKTNKVSMAIAIPLCGLAIKKGLNSLCK